MEKVRSLWEKILIKNSLSGNQIHLELLYKKGFDKDMKEVKRNLITDDDYIDAIREIVAYPVKINKYGRHDPRLLAHVEHALFGLRRYIIKGSWYNKFKRPEHKAVCEIDMANFTKMIETDPVFGKAYRHRIFEETKTGLQNWKNIGYHYPRDRVVKLKKKELKEYIETIYSLNIPTRESLSG